MDVKSLQVFLRLAESLHFTKAAARSHMSPPTLSRRIRQLEEEVGVPLFIRDQRSVALTPAGDAFKLYAQKALLQWEELQSNIQRGVLTLSGELSLFCSVTASYQLLSSLLPMFRQRYPEIEIRLHTGDQAESIDRVLSSQEDLAIAANPCIYPDNQLPQRLEFLPITHTGLVFIGPEMDAVFSSKLEDPLRYLAQLPFIFPETGVTRQTLEQWFLKKGIKPKIHSEVAGHEAIVAMVALGMGVAMVPELVLDNSPVVSQIRRLRAVGPKEKLEVGLCCLSKRLTNPLLDAFWQTAKDAFVPVVD